MFRKIIFALFLLVSFCSFGQVTTQNNKEVNVEENDSILNDTILLEEVFVYRVKLDPEAKKQFLLLQNRVYKVYPYAKIASERLTALNANMNKLKSNKDKKK